MVAKETRSADCLSGQPNSPPCPWPYVPAAAGRSSRVHRASTSVYTELKKGSCSRGHCRGWYFSTWWGCVRTISCVRTRTHSGVMFQCFPEPPRGEEESKALLREGMQTKGRMRRKEGGRETAAESVTSSWNLHRALGGGTESCFRGVLKGLYKLLPPVSSKRETVQIRKWSWLWNLNSLSHHTHLFSLQTAAEIFFIYEQYRIR